MEKSSRPLIDLLLQTSSSVVLGVDAEDRLLHLAGESALAHWLPNGTLPVPGSTLHETLGMLFDEPQATRIHEQHLALRAQAMPATALCPMLPGRSMRLAAIRWFDVTCARMACEQETAALLLITDRTLQQQLADSAASSRAAHDLALTVLRTDAAVLRQFLQSATAAIGFIRSTLRQPARTQESVREKLALLGSEAAALGAAAEQLSLRNIALPCQALSADIQALLTRDTLSGDDMLPLALRIDPVSAAIGATVSLDEQRAAPAAAPMPPPTPRAAPRSPPSWHEICEQRANEMIQRLCSRYGTLARLRMKGSALVSERYHRQIEAVLEPLLVNALKHGIETPEQRVAAGKPAAGTLTVTFRNRDAAGLEMSVHDDGRGFDLERIEAAARASGLLDAQADSDTDPRDVVGMIFKPGFSTATLAQLPGEGQGQGMALLRESLQRQGGNISVATKPHHYTQFTLRLPARNASAARPRPSHRDPARMSAPQP